MDIWETPLDPDWGAVIYLFFSDLSFLILYSSQESNIKSYH